MTNTDPVAYAITQGKDAAYLKRDGFTLLPQLPTEPGEYLLLLRGLKTPQGEVLPPVYFTVCVSSYEIREDAFLRIWTTAIGWMKLPDLPEWVSEYEPVEQQVSDEEDDEDESI